MMIDGKFSIDIGEAIAMVPDFDPIQNTESIGKPRSLCDKYVEQEFIAPFNEDAVVITKEWVINQYNTYIAGK